MRPEDTVSDVPTSPKSTPLNTGVDLTQGHRDTGTYRSWRFTTPFEQRIRELFDHDGVCYLAVHEVSKKGEEHWHVITLGDDDHERVKKHIQRRESFKAMKWWSKRNKGTFEKAVSYTMKTVDNCENKRVLKSEDWPDVEYVKWNFPVQKTIAASAGDDEPSKKKARVMERDWQLTYSNLVFQAVKFYRERSLSADITLKQCVRLMMTETKWRPCNQMYKCGVSEYYEQDFLYRIGQCRACSVRSGRKSRRSAARSRWSVDASTRSIFCEINRLS